MSLINSNEDAKLNTISSLTWLPWIGKDFFNSYKRFLIIGESHYADGSSEDAFSANLNLAAKNDFTRNTILQTQIQKAYEHKPLKNLFSALYGNKPINEEKLWSQLAYYNFVQRSMNYSNINGQKNTEQPTIKDFDKGWETFIEVAKILKPTDCIFIGVRAAEPFERMMDKLNIKRTDRIVHPEINNVSPRTASITIDGHQINLTFIKHTSAYFSPNTWSDFLEGRFEL
ncbi:hypothetical protein HX088_07870 [Empedobacter sp. 225-1]|uniref:hypothetical protein n=1 Tax=unclassified Empedobacter TaxID=2643773 RepID=UPI002577A4AF|nr:MULTISPECIES: hypothetical protein [unclassified Empedobacter]MDM1523185.1 hypothetical protein [Empedobacter sp. 225-1]MDM1543087.1 hypothetical protein [Empedobacter sp. 189-2]